MNNDLSVRRDILTETKALLILSRFPGTDMNLQDNGNYAISHAVDPSFNIDDICIDELVPTAKSVLLELQQRYGPNGELLGQIAPNYLLHSSPV